jgi:hypothetical protein
MAVARNKEDTKGAKAVILLQNIGRTAMCPITIIQGGNKRKKGESDRNLSNEQSLKKTNIVYRVSSFQPKREATWIAKHSG